MVIDIHSHLAYNKIFPERFLSGIAETLPGDGEGLRDMLRQMVQNSLNDADGSRFLKRMDEAGIDKAVLLIADFGYGLGEAALSLEEIFDLHHRVMKANPDRFIVFGGVDPRRGVAGYDLFERSVRDYGFSGLKLYPPCGFELDDPALYPLYEICAARRLPVLTHTGPSLGCMRTERAYPASILKVSAEFPHLNFILGHGGARDCDTTLAVVRQRPNVSFDCSTFQVYFKERERLERQFASFSRCCPEQMLFGTDWPMFLLSATQRRLRNIFEGLDIGSGNLDRLFFENAGRVLNQL